MTSCTYCGDQVEEKDWFHRIYHRKCVIKNYWSPVTMSFNGEKSYLFNESCREMDKRIKQTKREQRRAALKVRQKTKQTHFYPESGGDLGLPEPKAFNGQVRDPNKRGHWESSGGRG